MRISDWSSDVCSSDLKEQPIQNDSKSAKLRENGILPEEEFIEQKRNSLRSCRGSKSKLSHILLPAIPPVLLLPFFPSPLFCYFARIGSICRAARLFQKNIKQLASGFKRAFKQTGNAFKYSLGYSFSQLLD